MYASSSIPFIDLSKHLGNGISDLMMKSRNSVSLKIVMSHVYTKNNGVSERRNRSLLEKVRSMMSQTTLPNSFWDYALETAACILDMVPTKKVDKTPYEIWHGQAPKLSYLKVWGCEALVKHDTLTKPDKLDPRSFRCIFVGYPKKTMGYSFYNPSENKVFVAQNAEFFENDLIDQKASGSVDDLDLIQEEDTNPSIDTSLDHEKDDQEIDEPQSDINPIRRSTRTRRLIDRFCLYIDAKEHELGDLGEPANYKAALLDPESKKWLDAMNVEMQSMKYNDVWVLVELPPNARTVGIKWLFKKKTNMDADIIAIRILIAIAAYYDYEMWQMDVKTAFLNGHLSEEVYMEQPEDDMLLMGNNIPMLQDVKSYLRRSFAMKDLGDATYILGIKIYHDRSKRLIGLCQSAYIEKILKSYYMENSKRGTIPMQENLKLSKSQCASTPAEKQRIQNVPYASAIGLIMYDVRCTCPDVVFTQNITSQFQQNPGEEHWTAVKNILKYLRNTKDMFLIRYVFVLNRGVVDWKSTKQSIFATSSTDAKYIAAFDASKEAVWIRKFISGLGIVPTIEEPISMYCDNTEAIAIAKDDGVTKGASHFRSKVHYLRETIKLGDVKIEKINTDDNLANLFTKALAFPKHSELTRNIGMLSARDENHIRTLGDYSKPSHEGYKNIIELPEGNNLVPLRSDTIRLVQNRCSFHRVRSEDPNQHLKDFLKLVDSPDLNGDKKERTRMCLFQFPFAIKLAIGLNIFQQDPSQHGRILLLVSLLNSFHRKGLRNFVMTSLCSNKIKKSLSLKHGLCEIDCAAGGKLRDKNPNKSWEIIENLALYDHEGWNDSKDHVKPVKAVVVSPNASKTPDQRLLELEDQINFLLKGPQPTLNTSSTHTPQAYAKAFSLSPLPRGLNEPPRKSSFTFCERVHPNPQPQDLETSFEARREEINDKMAEMIGPLKELAASITLEKVLMREEARHPITKNVNSISLIRIEEEENGENIGQIYKSVMKPGKSNEEEPPKGIDMKNEVERKSDNEPAKSARENVRKNEEDEPAGVSNSHAVRYYLKHRINKLIKGLVEN
ncbi:retrotransposon protein, putative, ty1-copia subclass [Tanacetum coccineum]|uniref:Retrotransposon protein, putative, ty1-copia subclass n=1 Tax=Tanacetum coccineum TaxID=301880 RepID=A0ABQ5CV53_9ASTR